MPGSISEEIEFLVALAGILAPLMSAREREHRLWLREQLKTHCPAILAQAKGRQ